MAGWACFFLTAPACGDATGDSDTAAGEEGIAELCRSRCDRQARCDTSTPVEASCEADCLSEAPEPGLMRADVIEGWLDCYDQLVCDQSDDGCLEQVLSELEPDFADSPLLEECADIQRECGGFADETCSYAVTFTDAGKARLDACLSSSCELVGECIDDLDRRMP